MPKMYRDGQECYANTYQVEAMEKAGWSTENKPKPEPEPQLDIEDDYAEDEG
jgi:hypothetical protein